MTTTDGFTTEKELFRQVASNLTKELMLNSARDKVNQEAAKKAKAIMAQQLTKCNDVWHAFEKFLHKQVCEKSKTVDTVVIGIFKHSEGQVHYYP